MASSSPSLKMQDRTALLASGFRTCPGCTSGGDDIDQALCNAPEALELYAESFRADGKSLPRPRTLTELKSDPEIADGINTCMVALVALPARAHVAE